MSSDENDQIESTSRGSEIEANQIIDQTVMSELGKPALDGLLSKHKLLPSTLFELGNPLNQTNYESWHARFERKMRDKHLIDLIKHKWSAAVRNSHEWLDLDQRAKDNILNNVDPHFETYVQNKSTAYEMYEKLREHFEGSVILRGWRLCKSLTDLLTSARSEQLNEIAFQYQALVDKLTQLFPVIPSEFYVALYCAVLPAEYDYILSDILSQQNVTYEQVVSQTMSAYSRRQEHSEKSATLSNLAALQLANSESTKTLSNIGAFTSGKSADEKRNSSNPSKKKNKKSKQPKQPRHCDYCKRDGHDENCCLVKARDIIAGQTKDQNAENANQVNDRAPPRERLLAAFTMAVCGPDADELDSDAWYLDTCAGVSVTNSTDGLIGKLHKMDAQILDFENRPSKVQGVGRFELISETGIVLELSDVVYKSTASASYLSYGKLASTGKFKMVGENDWLKLYSKVTGNLVMTAKRQSSNLYKLELKPCPPSGRLCSVTISPHVPTEYLYRYWHCVLCHTSFGYLKKIAHILGIKERLRTRLVCDVCAMTKSAKLPFSVSHSRADRPFELVHADLSGIVRLANVENVNYYLLLIDDFSRFISIFLMGRKHQVPACYEQFINFIAVQFGAKVKCLRTDNGTEFRNAEMDRLTSGTARQYTAHGNPEQNGRAERAMRSIAEMARAILKQKGLSLRFWPYAVMYAVFIKNRLPHRAIGFKVPFEVLYEKAPDYQSIRPFGEQVFVLDQTATTKFSNPARPALFMGYPEGVKGYYVYLLNERKMDIVRSLHDSEEIANSQVQTESRYTVESDDPDIRMNPDHPYFSRPLFEKERECAQDNLLEQQQHQDVDEQDVSIYFSPVQSPQPAIPSDDEEVSARDSDVQSSLQTETAQSDQQNAADPGEPDSTPALFLKDLIDTDREDHSVYPKGRIIMNKSEKAWFQRVFPAATITHLVPYKAKMQSNQKCTIVRVSAVQPPRSYEKAISAPFRSVFQPAMEREMASQIAAGSFKLVERPKGAKVLPTVWLYKYVYDSAGGVTGGKARLVILGNQQLYEIGEKNYAPVVNYATLRTVLAFAVSRGLHIHHIDATTAFLNAEVEGVIYASQPKGFARPGEEHLVWRIEKSVYGLRQSARRWYLHLKRVLISMKFRQLLSDGCVFVKHVGDELLTVVAWVDDLLVICGDETALVEFKKSFNEQVKVKDHGQITNFLGIRCNYDRQSRVLELDQQTYLEQALESVGFDSCSRSASPFKVADAKKLETSDQSPDDPDFISCTLSDRDWFQSGVGKLMYVNTTYRFDLSYPVSLLAAAMHDPKAIHLRMLKQLLRYVQCTKQHRLVYRNGNDQLHSPSGLVVYADSSFGEKASRVGLLVFVSGNLVSWQSHKQDRVATSTSESEILAVHDSLNEIEFVTNLAGELGCDHLVPRPATVYNDNLSAKSSIETGGKFDKNKAYRNRLNRIIQAVEDLQVEAVYVRTAEMLADGLTKSIPGDVFRRHSQAVGLLAA